MKDFLINFFFRLLEKLPLDFLRVLGKITGKILILLNGKIYKYTLINLNLTHQHLPKDKLKDIANKAVINSAINFFEMPLIWSQDKKWLLEKLNKVNGNENLTAAFTKKNGAIVIIPHLGSWEFFGKYTSLNFPMTSMYQPPKLSNLDPLIKKGRESSGASLVPTNKTGIKKILKALKSNELVAILPDQVPKEGSGIYSNFFGIPAYTMNLVHNLLIKTSCEIIIGYAVRDNKGFNIFYENVSENIKNLDKEKSIDTMNIELEKVINKYKEQYEWSYKRFKKQPIGRKNPYKNG